jgi:hypothetical protein
MGIDGAATFTGNRSGVQAKLKKHTHLTLLVHCHCHKLQPAHLLLLSLQIILLPFAAF